MIQAYRVTRSEPKRWAARLAYALEWVCEATGHWNGCWLLNSSPLYGVWCKLSDLGHDWATIEPIYEQTTGSSATLTLWQGEWQYHDA